MRSLVIVVAALVILRPALGQSESRLLSSAQPTARTLVLRPAASAASAANRNPRVLHAAAGVVERRLRETGVRSPAVVVDDARGTLAVTIPADCSVDGLRDLLTRRARLEFRCLHQLNKAWRTAPEVVKGRVTGFEQIVGPDGRPVRRAELAAALSSKAPFTGADLQPTCRAESLGASAQSRMPARVGVHFEFKPNVKARFEAFTAQHTGHRLAIFLDDRLLSAPQIMAPIPGAGVIMARWDLPRARNLAAQLNSGPLPVPLELVR